MNNWRPSMMKQVCLSLCCFAALTSNPNNQSPRQCFDKNDNRQSNVARTLSARSLWINWRVSFHHHYQAPTPLNRSNNTALHWLLVDGLREGWKSLASYIVTKLHICCVIKDGKITTYELIFTTVTAVISVVIRWRSILQKEVGFLKSLKVETFQKPF